MSRILRSRMLFKSYGQTFAIPKRFNFQVRSLTDEARSAIDQAIKSKPVVLFMKGTPSAPQCGFSRATIQILGLQGVDPKKFASYNVLEDAELRSAIKEYSEWPTVPQLYVKGEFVGGCDIVMSMHESGELEEFLEKANALVPAEEAEEHAANEGEEVVVGQGAVEDIGVIQGDQPDGKKHDIKKVI